MTGSTDQTINTIRQIDSQIQGMYNDLEALSVEQNPNASEQNQILQKIQELQQLKTSLYTSVSNNYATTQSNVATSRNSLVNEMAVGGIVEHELKNVQGNLNSLQDARYGKLRMAEINNYYGDKYDTQAKVMKSIVYFCIPILILGLLMKRGILSSNIALILIAIILGLAIVVVLLQVFDIASRDNMNFSEYNFPFDPTAVDSSDMGNPNDQPVKIDLTLSCAGEACCPTGNVNGTKWDSSNKQCVTEGFVGERCLKNSFRKSDFNVGVFTNNSVVSGYNSSDSNSDNYAKF
jgi:hypothetical protein